MPAPASPPFSLQAFALLSGAFLLAGSARAQTDAPGPPADASAITLLRLNQPPCAVPSSQTIIKAKLAYRLAATEQSAYGFAVSIKFRSTMPGHTYSKGRLGVVTITQRHDTLTLEYPMAAILSDARLARPITCYFYLHRNTAPGRSHVIAQTPPIIFKECQ